MKITLVLAIPALLLLAGCGPNDAQTIPRIGAAATASSTTASASPDATPDHPIVDSPRAQSACAAAASTQGPGAKLLAAYDTSIADVVSWQENDPGARSVSVWRRHAPSETAWVCYYEGSFVIPCPGPCPQGTRESVIVAMDGTAGPWAVSYDSLSLTRPPHLNGPLPPAPTPQGGR